MKTITISVNDETYRLYQSRANAMGVSVEEWAAERLTKFMPKSRAKVGAGNARRKRQEIIDLIRSDNPVFSAADRLPREELYARDASR